MRYGLAALLAQAAVLGILSVGGCQNAPLGASAGGFDATYTCTILLYVHNGEGHAQQAEEYKHNTQQHTGWKDVYVVNHPGYSELCRGRYPSAEAAAADLKQAKNYRTPVGVQVFAQAIVMPLTEQAAGPTPYNLADSKGAFTVVVAEFYDVPGAGYVGRKKFAEQYCRQLRDKGTDAYVLHGSAKSLVCIGSFPESSYPTTTIGGKLQRVVRDPAMDKALKDFPKLAVNGRQDVLLVPAKSGKRMEKLTTTSYILEIPRKEPAADAAATHNRPGDAQSQ